MTRFASPQAAALAQQIDPQMAAGGGPTSSSTMPMLAGLLPQPQLQQTTLGESGGIYPRLGSLSSSIDSAEQELQGINQSIDSLQNQIGEPSGGQPGPVGIQGPIGSFKPIRVPLQQIGQGVGPRIPAGLNPRPAVDAPGGMQSIAGVGDPRLGAVQIPGNLMQMMMRGQSSRFGFADGGMETDRQEYGLGSIVKGIKKGVKGLVKGVGNVIKSPLGLAAIGLGINAFGLPNFMGGGGAGFLNKLGLPSLFKKSVGEGAALKNFGKVFLGGSALGALAGMGEEEQEMITRDVSSLRKYLTGYYQNLGYTADQIAEAVERDTSEYSSGQGGYADGGRIGYAMGTDQKVEMASGIESLPININPKGVKELDLRETGGFIPPVGVKEKADDIPAMLSNNEFVFTADAVRNAGGGDINKGAQLMYDTMKKLESRVV